MKFDQKGPTMPRLKRKHAKLMLAACNNSKVVTAVLFVCQHHPDGALNSYEAAVQHWITCTPTHRAASMEDLDALLKPARNRPRLVET